MDGHGGVDKKKNEKADCCSTNGDSNSTLITKTKGLVMESNLAPTFVISPTVESDGMVDFAAFNGGQTRSSDHPISTQSRPASKSSAEISRRPTPQSRTSSGSVTPNRAESSGSVRRSGSITHNTHPLPRRSTVSSVQRTASTGKSASKSLALHQPPHHPQTHHRPILPKPPSNPKPTAGPPSSEETLYVQDRLSPAGRTLSSADPGSASMLRRASSSSQSSRTASPALLPSASSIASSSTSAANQLFSQMIPDYAQSSYFSSGPDLTLDTLPPSHPSYSQVDPVEHADMALNSLLENGDFMAYLNTMNLSGDLNYGNSSVGGGGGIGTASSDSSGLDHSLTTPDLLWDGQAASIGGGGSEGLDLYEALARSIAQAATSGAEDTVGGSQPAGNGYDPAYSGGPSFERSPSSTSAQNGVRGAGHLETPPYSYPQSTSQTDSQSLNRNIAFSPELQIQALQQAVSTGVAGSSNPNLIDLSKPLDAGDVERILKALQKQQQVQAQAEGSTTLPDIPQLSQGAWTGYEKPTATAGTKSTPSQHYQYDVPAPSLTGTSEIDDLFENFVFDPNLVRDATGGDGPDDDQFDLGQYSGSTGDEWSNAQLAVVNGIGARRDQGANQDGVLTYPMTANTGLLESSEIMARARAQRDEQQKILVATFRRATGL
jgi:hypothetical protein